jgi:hypothetical protein
MKYLVISQSGNLYMVEKSEDVDEILRQREGVFYVISMYPAYVMVEKYQAANHKIYRIDSVKL